MTEDQLEQQCLAWFAEGGWETTHGPELALLTERGLQPQQL